MNYIFTFLLLVGIAIAGGLALGYDFSTLTSKIISIPNQISSGSSWIKLVLIVSGICFLVNFFSGIFGIISLILVLNGSWLLFKVDDCGADNCLERAMIPFIILVGVTFIRLFFLKGDDDF